MKIECSDNYVRLGEKSYPCTVSLAMDLIGGKWKTVILYHLQTGEKRFGELHKAMAGVTEMTLSLQLKQLEKEEKEAQEKADLYGPAFRVPPDDPEGGDVGDGKP